MAELNNYRIQDYRDTYDYCKTVSKYGLSKMPPLIITCAITGGAQGKESNPNLPETVAEQAQQSYDAYNAGAAMIHIHRRDPDNPAVATQRWQDYLEVNAAIRDRCPELIINNTCVGQRHAKPDGRGGYQVGKQMLVSINALPEVSSVDITCHCSNLLLPARKPPLYGRDEPVMRNEAAFMAYDELEYVVTEMRSRGIKPEYECFRPDNFKYLNYLEERGLLEDPFWVQMLFNGNGTTPVVEQMLTAARMLPKNGMLSVIGIGAAQTALLTQAIILGHHVRVGLEDSIYYGPRELAKSNAQLVERVVRIATELGRPIATPAQAREMMGLDKPRNYTFPRRA